MQLRFSILSAILFAAFLPSVPAEASHVARARILAVLSYEPDFPTSADILSGLETTFPPADYELNILFLGTKRHFDDRHRNLAAQLLAEEVSERYRPALVLTFDDNALRLALSLRSRLGAIPIVYAGVNDPELAKSVAPDPLVCGLFETLSIRETLDLIQRLRPRASALTVISDATDTGEALLTALRAQLGRLPIDLIDFSHTTVGDLHTRLSRLDPNGAVLLLSAYEGYGGSPFGFYESLGIIASSSRVPVFHLWKHGIGAGLVGGKVVSQKEQALGAGRLAKRILAGESPAALKSMSASPNLYLFDWNALQRFHIDARELPDESVILNTPPSLRAIHPNLFLALVVASVACLGFIISLLIVLLYRGHIALRLRRNLEFFRGLIRAIKDPVYLKDADGNYLMVNTAFAELFGKTVDEVVGEKVTDIASDDFSLTVQDLDDRVLQTGNEETREVFFENDGRQRILEMTKHRMIDESGKTVLLGTMHDLSSERQIQEALKGMNLRLEAEVAERTHELEEANRKLADANLELRHLAGTDTLTGLSNRRRLRPVLDDEVALMERYGTPFSVIMIDIDFFKAVNDELGHDAGDIALSALGRILRERVRATDLPGRWGGEEFVVLCRASALPSATGLAESLCREIAGAAILPNRTITASFGVAEARKGDTPYSLIARADERLYTAKSNGRNRVES